MKAQELVMKGNQSLIKQIVFTKFLTKDNYSPWHSLLQTTIVFPRNRQTLWTRNLVVTMTLLITMQESTRVTRLVRNYLWSQMSRW